MKIIVGDRATGKTFRMIEWFVEDPMKRGIICAHWGAKMRIMDRITKHDPKLADTMSAWSHNIWTLQTLHTRRGRDRLKEVWIDDADLILHELTGHAGSITLASSEEVEVRHI